MPRSRAKVKEELAAARERHDWGACQDLERELMVLERGPQRKLGLNLYRQETYPIVDLMYPGRIDLPLDSKLEAFAMKLEGVRIGGGAYLGGEMERDLTFEFPTMAQAEEFIATVNRFDFFEDN